MDKSLEELHNLANSAFQNVSHLTPVLRHLVANAKTYQKSVQTTCNLAVMFIESFQQIANAAFASEGSTKKLGEVVVDIIDAFKEIENMKLELTKLFINEVIIPLESKAENEINQIKSTQKSYNQENKIQSELTDKAISGASKYRKKSMKKKKPSIKLEEKEKMSTQLKDEEVVKLKKVREEGLRKALIDERRMYCFVAERMCSYGRGMVVYNNRISNFMNQKLPDWQQFIAKPTELPQESENIILNPTDYKMGTVKSSSLKHERKESIKRRKSFNSHFPTKYSTMEGRASRGGSRPTLSNISMAQSNSSLASPGTPTVKTPAQKSPLITPTSISNQDGFYGNNSSPTQRSVNGDVISMYGGDKNESPPIGLYVVPVDSPTSPRSEYANVVVLPKDDVDITTRSLSFSGAIHKPVRIKTELCRTESDGIDLKNNSKDSIEPVEKENDFSDQLAAIQTQLSDKIKIKSASENPTEESKSYLKALYKHEAHDASQLSFDQDDIIVPVCEPTAGWQYGENEKTKKSGWFPAAFTEVITNRKETNRSRFVRKPPPVMAKKASLRNGGGNRKISVAVTQLVHPSRTNVDLVRRGSHGG